MTSAIACIRCAAPLPPESWNRPGLVSCLSCGSRVAAVVFPAFLRGPGPSSAPGPAAVEGEASCFFHAGNRAVTPCGSCGRFLCAVCDVEFGGRHLCPMCLETGKKKGKWKNLEEGRTLYGQIALALALYPMLFIYATIVTAPIALYVGIRYWKAPLSIVGGTKLPHAAAILIALLQITGWIVLLVFLIHGFQSGSLRR
jgi:hypothetical protein